MDWRPCFWCHSIEDITMTALDRVGKAVDEFLDKVAG
jgi:hypothetical protein